MRVLKVTCGIKNENYVLILHVQLINKHPCRWALQEYNIHISHIHCKSQPNKHKHKNNFLRDCAYKSNPQATQHSYNIGDLCTLGGLKGYSAEKCMSRKKTPPSYTEPGGPRMVETHSYRLSPLGPALQFGGGSSVISANSFCILLDKN